MLNLPWKNVDPVKRVIKVEKTKGKKTRYIPINTTLLKELELLRVENAESDLVFPFKSVRTAFENARKKAGLENLTFHDLRRTFGTRLLEMGVDIVTIQKLYGHSSVLVTQRYLHPQDSIKKEAVELLDHAGKMKADPFHICSTEKEGKPLIH